VVLLEVDKMRMAAGELESDTPGTVDMDRVACGLEPAQPMEIKPRNIYFLGSLSDIKAVQAPQDPIMHASVDTPSIACLPKFGDAYIGQDAVVPLDSP
jgi:hypothetical protein